MHLAAWIIGAVSGLSAVAVVWFGFGRRVAALVDHLWIGKPIPQATSPMRIEYDPAGIGSVITLGSKRWPLSWPRPSALDVKILRLATDRLVLASKGSEFELGPIALVWDDASARPQYEFVPDAGDVVTFTRTVSALPWWTPFTFSILGGARSTRKRRAYDELRWTKTSGQTLIIRWTDEIWFYRALGWSDTYLNRLRKVCIRNP